jgi:hypothetical protein
MEGVQRRAAHRARVARLSAIDLQLEACGFITGRQFARDAPVTDEIVALLDEKVELWNAIGIHYACICNSWMKMRDNARERMRAQETDDEK